MKKSILLLLSFLLISSQCFAETNSYYIDDSPFTKRLESSPTLFKTDNNRSIADFNQSNRIKAKELTLYHEHYSAKEVIQLGGALLLLNPEAITTQNNIEGMLLVTGFVLGTVIVFGFIVDGVWILSRVIENNYSQIDKWIDVGTTLSYFSHSNRNSDITKHSIYGGLSISSGLKDKKSGIGFVAEMGYIDLSLANKSTLDKKASGFYGMIGPTLRLFFRKGGVLHFDCMAGKSSLKEIEIMGLFRVGINYPLTQHTFLDFNYGVHYLVDEPTDGYIQNRKLNSNYNSIFGFQLGYRF